MAPKGPPKARKYAVAGLSSVGVIYVRGFGVSRTGNHVPARDPPRLVPGRLRGYIFGTRQWWIQMRALFLVIDLALQLYIWILIASAILSWLVAFNVVNTRNPVVASVGEFLYRITEPALRPIRNAMPSLGGIDISPVILILVIIFIRYVIALYILPNVF
jgi:YggT family protein